MWILEVKRNIYQISKLRYTCMYTVLLSCIFYPEFTSLMIKQVVSGFLITGNALAQLQWVHEPVDLWDITFCTRRFWPINFQKIILCTYLERAFFKNPSFWAWADNWAVSSLSMGKCIWLFFGIFSSGIHWWVSSVGFQIKIGRPKFYAGETA